MKRVVFLVLKYLSILIVSYFSVIGFLIFALWVNTKENTEVLNNFMLVGTSCFFFLMIVMCIGLFLGYVIELVKNIKFNK